MFWNPRHEKAHKHSLWWKQTTCEWLWDYVKPKRHKSSKVIYILDTYVIWYYKMTDAQENVSTES